MEEWEEPSLPDPKAFMFCKDKNKLKLYDVNIVCYINISLEPICPVMIIFETKESIIKMVNFFSRLGTVAINTLFINNIFPTVL